MFVFWRVLQQNFRLLLAPLLLALLFLQWSVVPAVQAQEDEAVVLRPGKEKNRRRDGSLPFQLYMGLGAFTENVGKVTASADSSGAIFSRVFLDLDMLARVGIGSSFSLYPEMMVTPVGRTTEDNGAQARYYMLAPLAGMALSGLDLRAGPSILFYSFAGGGGSVLRDNGVGEDAFFLPSRAATSRMLALNLATGFLLGDALIPNDRKVRVDIHMVVPGVFTQRRAFHLMVNLTYGIMTRDGG